MAVFKSRPGPKSSPRLAFLGDVWRAWMTETGHMDEGEAVQHVFSAPRNTSCYRTPIQPMAGKRRLCAKLNIQYGKGGSPAAIPLSPPRTKKKRTGCDMRIDRKRSFSIDNSRYTRHEDDRLQRGRVNWLAPLSGPDAFWLASA